MYWTFYFIIGLTVVTGQQECKNAAFNDCIFPTVYNAVHADSIEMCADVCDVFASIGSCSMYSFDTNGFIDENCKLYDMRTPIPDFQAQCNEVGVPVNDECVFYDDECTATNSCPTCIACGTGTCGGYMDMDCEFQGEILERHPGIPFDTCQELCKVEKAAYIHYYRESQNCLCMASDKRVCKKQVVKYGTDINVCNDLAPSECKNYHSFDQDDRNEYSSEEGWFCDSSEKHTSEDWHGEGWYRFTGKAGKQMADSAPCNYCCGTGGTGWLNGDHPSVHDGIVERQVCFSYEGSKCHWKTTANVRNCGDFYVYQLQETPECVLRYCGK